jgi:hypothetical protein
MNTRLELKEGGLVLVEFRAAPGNDCGRLFVHDVRAEGKGSEDSWTHGIYALLDSG